MKIPRDEFLKKKSIQLRRKIIQMAFAGNGSHISSCLSSTDILTVLYWKILRIKPKKPDYQKRDKFILSKGHTASALYAILAQKGFFPEKILETYGKEGTILGAHPEYQALPGIELSTGSLGHGLSIGIGKALAAKLNRHPSRIFVLLSDGECDEGSVWEAALFAGHHHLDNLVVIIDYNKFQAFGKTKDVIDLEPLAHKWRSFGWATKEIDGHNLKKIEKVLKVIPQVKKKPTVIIAHTISGKGISFLENKLEWHYFNLNKEQYKKSLEELDKL
jgi:transketolase